MLEFYANPDKKVDIEVNDKTYLRHAIKTHFVKPGENYVDIFKQYVEPVYEEGDIVSISEKIIALCQERICYAKNMKISFWAKFLAKFVMKTPAGFGIGNPYKMQVAIDLCGLPKIIFAALVAAVFKLFKKRGVFYKIVGNGVAGIDGFYSGAFDFYGDKGILNPENPDKVCDEIKEKLGISCMIVDANDLNIDILGKSSDIQFDENTLKGLIKDNPAGQSAQQTPIILIRPKEAVQSDEVKEDVAVESPKTETIVVENVACSSQEA